MTSASAIMSGRCHKMWTTTVNTYNEHVTQYKYKILRTRRDSLASTLHFFKALYMPTTHNIMRTQLVQLGRTYYISSSFVFVVLDV